MIGPHQGKGLELMISGKKHLALFSDELLPRQPISEEIIPDKAFAPHVQSDKIVRFQRIESKKKARMIVPRP